MNLKSLAHLEEINASNKKKAHLNWLKDTLEQIAHHISKHITVTTGNEETNTTTKQEFF